MNRSTVSDAIFAALCVCAIDVVIKLVKLGIICAWVVVSTVAVIFYELFFGNSQESGDKA